MPIKYVGRPSPWHGKALFEILVNLKDFGLGRMVVRNNLERYAEPTYYIVRKVEPKMDSDNKLGIAYLETIFRGKNLGVQEVRCVWKTDFKLIPKHEEDTVKMKNLNSRYEYLTERTVPRYINAPPLLRELLTKENGVEPKIPTVINNRINNRAKIVEEGKEPNIKFQPPLHILYGNDVTIDDSATL